MNKRTAPLSNVPAESALLGALMRGEHAFWQICDTVKASDFVAPLHRDIYGAIKDILEERKKFSVTALQTRLPEQAVGPDGEEVTVSGYIAALILNADGLSAIDFADQVAQTASRRQLIAIGESMIKAAKIGDRPAIDIATEIETSILDVMQVTAPKRPRRLSELVGKALTSSHSAREKNIMPGFTTGLQSLDEMIGLIMGGDLLTCLGSQGDGKSIVLGQIGMHIAQSRPVLCFHNEMGEEQVAVRQIAEASGLSVRAVREGAYTFSDVDLLNEARRKLEHPEFWVLYDPKVTVRHMRAHCFAMKRTIGLGAVVVDQLTHIKTETTHRNKFDRLEEITSDLKTLAGELEVPVLLAAQRTRTAQRSDDPTPAINDADAPSVERDSDIVIGIWRKENWLRRNKPNTKSGGEAWERWEYQIKESAPFAEVIALKLRSGPAYEQRKFKWSGLRMRLDEI